MKKTTKGLKIHFGFGRGQRKNGQAITIAESRLAMSLLKHEAARLFGGYSFTRIEGGWVNPAGKLVEEPGGILEVVTTRDYRSMVKLAKAFRETIKQVLDQEAIVLTITECKFTEIA